MLLLPSDFRVKLESMSYSSQSTRPVGRVLWEELLVLSSMSRQVEFQGIFCPSIGAEFRPHSQSKIATFFPNTMSVFPNFFFKRPLLLMRNNDPYQNDT